MFVVQSRDPESRKHLQPALARPLASCEGEQGRALASLEREALLWEELLCSSAQWFGEF